MKKSRKGQQTLCTCHRRFDGLVWFMKNENKVHQRNTFKYQGKKQ